MIGDCEGPLMRLERAQREIDRLRDFLRIAEAAIKVHESRYATTVQRYENALDGLIGELEGMKLPHDCSCGCSFSEPEFDAQVTALQDKIRNIKGGNP